MICKFDWEHQYRSTHSDFCYTCIASAPNTLSEGVFSAPQTHSKKPLQEGFGAYGYIDSELSSCEFGICFFVQKSRSLEFEVKEVDLKMIMVKPEIMMMFEARISYDNGVNLPFCDSSHSFQDVYFEKFF